MIQRTKNTSKDDFSGILHEDSFGMTGDVVIINMREIVKEPFTELTSRTV